MRLRLLPLLSVSVALLSSTLASATSDNPFQTEVVEPARVQVEDNLPGLLYGPKPTFETPQSSSRGTSSEWVLLDAGTGPEPRLAHSSAFDSERGQLLIFGGWKEAALGVFEETNDLWGWNGTKWELLDDGTGNAPPSRVQGGMAFDPLLGVTVLFGGLSMTGTPQGFLNDTWLWNGNNWAELIIPAESNPNGRAEHGMIYYPPLGSVVTMFGMKGAQALSDGWRFNGVVWEELAFEWNGGVAEGDCGISYIPSTQMIFYNGSFSVGPPSTLLMAPDLSWNAIGTPLPANMRHQIPASGAYSPDDSSGNMTVLGGHGIQYWFEDGAVWQFSVAGGWSKVDTDSPPPRTYASLVADGEGHLLAFGGADKDFTHGYNDLWELRSPTSSTPTPSMSHQASLRAEPNPASSTTRIVFDSSTNRAISLRSFDATGRLIQQFTVTSSRGYVDWDTSDLESGVYFLKLETESGQAVERLVVR